MHIISQGDFLPFKRRGQCTCTCCSISSPLHHLPRCWHSSRRHRKNILCCCCRRRSCRLQSTWEMNKFSWGRCTCTCRSNSFSLCLLPQFQGSNRHRRTSILHCCSRRRNCRLPCTQGDHILDLVHPGCPDRRTHTWCSTSC